MIPVAVAVVLLVASLGCFYYIFRGFTSSDNPVLGNILATSINGIICVFFMMWFLNGGIADSQIIKNATYSIDFGPLTGETLPGSFAISYVNTSAGQNQYVLQENGAGMYTTATINAFSVIPLGAQDLSIGHFVADYNTYDIIYTQYQEKTLAYFFLFLAVINAALFLWFVFSAGWPAIMQFIRGSPPPAGENVG